MADGFRVLENGDYRITEADVFRITEKFSEAFSDLTASGSLSSLQSLKQVGFFDNGGEGYCTSSATLTKYGASNLISTGTLSDIGNLKASGSSSFTGTGTLDSTGRVVKFIFSNLSATGTASFDGHTTYRTTVDMQAIGSEAFFSIGKFIGHVHNFNGVASITEDSRLVAYRNSDLQATGSMTVIPDLTLNGVTSLNATSSISPLGYRIKFGESALSGAGTIAADGDVRLGGSTSLNASGSISPEGTLIPFTSTMYVKVSGAWKTSTPYVKHAGTWKIPEYIYKKVSGTWTRVY